MVNVTGTEGPVQPIADVAATLQVVVTVTPEAVGFCSVGSLRNVDGVHNHVLAVAGTFVPTVNETVIVWLGALQVAVFIPPQLRLLISGRIT